MLRSKPLTIGRLLGVIYDFEEIGDELPLHVHDSESIHISILARGRLKVFGHGWEQEVDTGAVLDWQVGQWHGFIALEPNTRLVNIHK